MVFVVLENLSSLGLFIFLLLLGLCSESCSFLFHSLNILSGHIISVFVYQCAFSDRFSYLSFSLLIPLSCAQFAMSYYFQLYFSALGSFFTYFLLFGHLKNSLVFIL